MRRVALCALFAVSSVATAGADTATTNHIYFNVANDAGVKYKNWDYSYYGNGSGAYTGAVGPDAYLIKADGGGTNELKISTVTTGGNVTSIDSTSNNPSGYFYVTNSGGRGFDNEIILALAVVPPISDNFAVHIKSGGYTWTPAAPGSYTPPPPTDYVHITGIDETFTKTDFIYGPQTGRPGTGLGGATLAIFNSDLAMNTSAYLMFIDLNVGNIKNTSITGLQDDGAAKVEFSFSGLDGATKIAFNSYGWASASNQGEGINWTNAMTGSGASGYYINATPLDTVYPTGEVTYAPSRPYRAGDVVTVTATFSEPMADAPVPSITLSGAASGTFAMTKVSSTVYTYSYTVDSGEGAVAVALSGTDLDGNRVAPTPASGGTFAVDNTAPTVKISATGAVGNVNVGIAAQIKATFSEAVDALTLSPATFGIVGVDGAVKYDAATHTATFTPAAQLTPESAYSVVVDGVKDLAGNVMSPTPVQWDFSTTGAADILPPKADELTYSPAGPYKAGTLVTVTAAFSEAMALAPAPQIAFSGAATLAPVEMTRVDVNLYTYTFTAGAGDGVVTVSLSGGADLAGNELVPTPTAGGTFTIDNTPPAAVFSPANGAAEVPVDTVVKATFSEPVDPASIGIATFAGIPGSVSYNATTNSAVFVPTDPLGPGLVYTVTVTGVRDLAGNPMAPATIAFTAAGIPDAVPPTAAITYSPAPPYKAGAVITVRANFSEAMASAPLPAIDVFGADYAGPVDMTRLSSTEYKYIYTVGAGDGDVAVRLGNATDLSKNVVVPTPTSGGSFTVDNTPPAVVSVSPANDAVDVSVTTKITATFSEEMNVASAFMSASNLTIPNVSCTMTYDPAARTATFTPSHPIPYGTTFTATLSGMKDVAGNDLGQTSWTFSTVPLYGDLKGTGEPPTIQDALLALQMAVGLITPTPAQMQSGDIAPLVNGRPHPDGEIDISDAIVILRNVVGAIVW